MNTQISANKSNIIALMSLIGTLPEGSASKTIIAYIADAIVESQTNLISNI